MTSGNTKKSANFGKNLFLKSLFNVLKTNLIVLILYLAFVFKYFYVSELFWYICKKVKIRILVEKSKILYTLTHPTFACLFIARIVYRVRTISDFYLYSLSITNV